MTALTDEQITEYLTEWVKSYCHNDFEDGLPGGVLLFLDQALEFQKTATSVEREQLGEYVIKFREDYPKATMGLLKPYKRAKGVDNTGDVWK